MKCPYCGKEMELGLIESPEPMNYLTQKRFINRPKEELGEFNLAKPPFGGHATIDAWLCRDCKKIIVEY